ncbi:DUF4365 domain-containing protein [Arcticibacter tournemirensis]|uniref:DUF4365 domain-containing protein n=1 Tax=Arcticibacter tournemirensis TaxID=699437 RepID=A0A4V1KIF6_9SPHI|nr:DUF4365 domain-containing protein [Arcticibacter tournemirensis]RXF70522.1 DUF4365 domain-containing protein [Arcticibacter tournemirensis]
MARKKRRVNQHIMEDESYRIIKKLIPKEWVIREFNRPDYGIDLIIELFEEIDNKTFETLGEFIYVQVKSSEQIPISTEKIYGVQNAAKGKLVQDRSKYANLDIVKYRYDTNSIYTIQSLGASVSVLLFFVDIQSEDVYFINMNDYIDKIILPQKLYYVDYGTLTIKIPTLNNLKNSAISSTALGIYGKRSKLLAAFSKFNYQRNELSYVLGIKFWPVYTYRDTLEKDMTEKEIYDLAVFFIMQNEDLDIWKYRSWRVLPEVKKEMELLKRYLKDHQPQWDKARNDIIMLWQRLTSLNVMYEDLIRELYLPKMISLMTSYPYPPEIIEGKIVNPTSKGKA